jgi:hypothetical protein
MRPREVFAFRGRFYKAVQLSAEPWQTGSNASLRSVRDALPEQVEMIGYRFLDRACSINPEHPQRLDTLTDSFANTVFGHVSVLVSEQPLRMTRVAGVTRGLGSYRN